MPTSNIDDLLMGGNISSTQPATPEYQDLNNDTTDESEHELPQQTDIMDDAYASDEPEEEIEEEEQVKEVAAEVDDYGNEKPKPRTYTEAEHKEILNKVMRDRVSQFERNNPQASINNQQMQQQVEKNFEYDADSDASWMQQLEKVVEQTVTKMTHKQQQQQHEQAEIQAQQDFRDRFSQGMDRFVDFVDVVSSQPITPTMTGAMRGIEDPAAFIYAASKRHPKELERISNLRDPYAQVVEMGRLEERMRKSPQGTNAPKPISKTKDDGNFKEKPKQDDNDIDMQIAQFEAKKRAQMKARRGN